MWIVCHIEVEIADVAEHNAVAIVSHRIRHGVVTPIGHGLPTVDATKLIAQMLVDRCAMAHCRFLPTADAYTFGVGDVGNTSDVVLFNVVGRLKATALHQILHRRRQRPRIARHFVATDMDIGQVDAGTLIHGDNLVDNLLHKPIRAFHRRIEHIVVIALCGGVDRAVVGVVEAIAPSLNGIGCGITAIARTHSRDGCTSVSRRFDFGDYFDADAVGKAQEVDKLVDGDISVGGCRAVGIAVAVIELAQKVGFRACQATSSANVGEFGQPGDLQSPAFVVGQVEV